MSDAKLGNQLASLLEGRGAHVTIHDVLDDFPYEWLGRKPAGAPHTAWQLFEHLRIAQWDILEFSRDPEHVSPEFPDGYWPDAEAPASLDEWKRRLAEFKAQLGEMKQWAETAGPDLFTKIPHGSGQTLLREALLVADHNAYHTGQLVTIRQALGEWPG